MKAWIVNICRVLVGLTFVCSGFVKAIDPLGTQYKIQDYMTAAGLGNLLPDFLTLAASVALSGLEFTMGVLLILAIGRRFTSRLALVFMAIMTAVTVWIYIADPVQDCGCFGDAVVLSNGATLLKNIILTACTIILALWPTSMFRSLSRSNQWIVFHYTIAFSLAVSAWCLYDLPLFDFRPYHVGADIRKGMEIPEDAEQPKFETTFILEKDGKQQEFTLNNYPDSTWTFIDSKTKQISKGYVPPIHDFSIMDGEDDITEDIISDPGYTFMLIAPWLEKADDSSFGNIDEIYEYAEDNDCRFLCITSSGKKGIEQWRDITGAEYPIFNADGTTLKTIIRSNPGLVLMHDGKVIGKWSHNSLPHGDELKSNINEAEWAKPDFSSALWRVIRVMLWFIIPLIILVIADRLWAWSQWVKDKEQKIQGKKTNNFSNKTKKTMRKKIVAGNWKMNKNLQEGVALAKELTEVVKNPNCEVIIGTPFIHLASVADVIKDSCIKLSAENCANKAAGAYTGEVSAEMVKSTGAEYVILGHSERREYYNETPEILKEKVELALENGLKVIFCIGESLAQREANEQEAVCKAELAGSVFHLTAEQWKNIVIAYEPIWAIGTGKTATAEQAEEIHAYIRSCVAEVYGAEVADDTTILYGGSCKASNAPELFAKANIDGGLIGGASLKAADFKGIIDAWN